MEEKDVLVDKFQSSVQALNEDVVKTNEEKLLQKNVSDNAFKCRFYSTHFGTNRARFFAADLFIHQCPKFCLVSLCFRKAVLSGGLHPKLPLGASKLRLCQKVMHILP